MKIVLTLFSLIGICNISFTQSFGLKFGVNIAKFQRNAVGLGNDIQQSKIGYQIGASYEYPLNDYFSITSGLSISEKGTKILRSFYFYPQTDGILISKTNLTYLEIPINLKINIYENDFKVYGIFGGYSGIGIVSKLKVSTKNVVPNNDVEKDAINLVVGTKKLNFGDLENDSKRIDLGLNIGAGFEINQFDFSLNYGLGLRNLITNSYILQNGDASVRNRVLSIIVCYRFGE
jgi:Outer membrane protein beta-barrel domain